MKKQVLFGNRVVVGISDIHDGTMRFFGEGEETEIIERQKRLGEIVNLDGEKVARIRTVYEGRDNYTFYDEINEGNIVEYSINNLEESIPISDGLVTRSDMGMLLPIADCLGMVVFDEEQEITGLLHAGRQNIEQDGPRKFIEMFVNKYNSDVKKLKVYFSPCAQNYEITKLNGEKIPDATRRQITEMGVLVENIIEDGTDTVTSSDYPSRSAGDMIDRFAIVVKRC